MGARLIIGDVRAVLATIPDGSIDLVVTSPPFLALRSYLPSDHPEKELEIGSEATPAEFIDALLALTAEWRRVLAPHGSIAVELGDTYAGSGGGGGDYAADGLRAGQPKFDGSARRGIAGWPLAKSLCFTPELYGVALAYGINPLTGAESPAGRWRVRNKVAWCRPNPPVGALGDKFRPATSYITVACTARDRWFDLEELRGEPSPNTHARTAAGVEQVERSGKSGDRDGNWSSLPELARTAGAPPLDWWEIPTQPYKGAHYATFPEELPRRLILAMCPREVCVACGKPRRRIVRVSQQDTGRTTNGSKARDRAETYAGSTYATRTVASIATVGWTDCGCGAGWRPGVVLDPFAGSGTTMAVAQGLGRDAVGIDLDERNEHLCRERVGMFLAVEHLAVEA